MLYILLWLTASVTTNLSHDREAHWMLLFRTHYGNLGSRNTPGPCGGIWLAWLAPSRGWARRLAAGPARGFPAWSCPSCCCCWLAAAALARWTCKSKAGCRCSPWIPSRSGACHLNLGTPMTPGRTPGMPCTICMPGKPPITTWPPIPSMAASEGKVSENYKSWGAVRSEYRNSDSQPR